MSLCQAVHLIDLHVPEPPLPPQSTPSCPFAGTAPYFDFLLILSLGA